MGDDGDAVHSDERAAAICFVIGFVANRAEGVLREERAGLALGFAVSSRLSQLNTALAVALAGLQHDVAGKAVAEDDLDRRSKRSWPSTLPRKFSLLALRSLKISFVNSFAFLVLAADRHEADGRIFFAEDELRDDRAHDRILEHVNSSGIDVRACVDEHADVVLGGQIARDAGPLDALERRSLIVVEATIAPGVAGAHHGIGVALLDEIDGAIDGRVLLLRTASTA